jgi:hypothetical protein
VSRALLPPAGYVSTGTARILNSLRMLVALHKVNARAQTALLATRSKTALDATLPFLECWVGSHVHSFMVSSRHADAPATALQILS